MAAYIKYESECFRGVVGPFRDREAASEWASSLGGTASWEGASVYDPDEAELEIVEACREAVVGD